MDDETAFMELVLSNAQGELSPLERGMHAFDFAEKEKGGKAKKGGVREYARRVGVSEAYIRQLRDAAEVIRSVDTAQLTTQYIDKAQHLTAIHRAPRETWAALVSTLIAKSWSVADTEHWVAKVSEFKIPEKWQTRKDDGESEAARRANFGWARRGAQFAQNFTLKSSVCEGCSTGLRPRAPGAAARS